MALEAARQVAFDFDDFEEKLKLRVAREMSRTDFIHTLLVVKNVKRIVSLEGGRRDVLVTAAYLHEFGRGDGGLILSDKLDVSPVMFRCKECGRKARGLLADFHFPPEKAEQVARLLEGNTCLEIKRGHHNIV